MMYPNTPSDENKRFEDLLEYSILDTLPEMEYDNITLLAAQICGTPVSLISLIDDKRQWFKSRHGLDAESTPREVAFCAHAINDKNKLLVIPDSRKDERFHDNPLVTGDPNVIFYAGIPLVSPKGYALGTLCVIDNQPKTLDQKQQDALRALGNQVIKLFEFRKTTIALQTKIYELEVQVKGLNAFASAAAHDMKSPLSSITMLSDFLADQYAKYLPDKGLKLIGSISKASYKLVGLIDGILKYSKDSRLLSEDRQEIEVIGIIRELIVLIDSTHRAQIIIEPTTPLRLFTNKVAFEQIIINLFTNALKYNDKELPIITIIIDDQPDTIKINIMDNGPGIRERDRERIFNIFETTINKDNTGNRGNGIGLATVKSLVEGLGGHIHVTSELGKSCDFEFTIRK